MTFSTILDSLKKYEKIIPESHHYVVALTNISVTEYIELKDMVTPYINDDTDKFLGNISGIIYDDLKKVNVNSDKIPGIKGVGVKTLQKHRAGEAALAGRRMRARAAEGVGRCSACIASRAGRGGQLATKANGSGRGAGHYPTAPACQRASRWPFRRVEAASPYNINSIQRADVADAAHRDVERHLLAERLVDLLGARAAAVGGGLRGVPLHVEGAVEHAVDPRSRGTRAISARARVGAGVGIRIWLSLWEAASAQGKRPQVACVHVESDTELGSIEGRRAVPEGLE